MIVARWSHAEQATIGHKCSHCPVCIVHGTTHTTTGELIVCVLLLFITLYPPSLYPFP